MTHEKVDLKLDWVSHKAAKYACEHWHYSKTIPVGKSVKIGVWEDSKFIGVVIFSRGANNNLAKSFNLNQSEVCELTRIALTRHKTSVSRICSIAIKILKNNNKGLKLIVSYADTAQGHIGGIYQAGNWHYIGESKTTIYLVNGEPKHKRTIASKYGTNKTDKLSNMGINIKTLKGKVKYKYIMPLTKEMKDKIKHLSKPYPKRPKQETVITSDMSVVQRQPGRSKLEARA